MAYDWLSAGVCASAGGRLTRFCCAQYAMTYARGMNILVSSLPFYARRLFGGLAWVMLLLSGIQLYSSWTAINSFAHHGALWRTFVVAAHGTNMVRSTHE